VIAPDAPIVLIPTSPTYFRFEGMGVGSGVRFELTDGRVTTATPQYGGEDDEKLTRKP
jgi:hypothetical protein